MPVLDEGCFNDVDTENGLGLLETCVVGLLDASEDGLSTDVWDISEVELGTVAFVGAEVALIGVVPGRSFVVYMSLDVWDTVVSVRLAGCMPSRMFSGSRPVSGGCESS